MWIFRGALKATAPFQLSHRRHPQQASGNSAKRNFLTIACRIASGKPEEQLGAIAWSLKTRPRKSREFWSPAEVYSELLLNMELTKPATKH